NELMRVASAMVARGKGILAADESTGSIKKRFDSIKLESTEEHRRTYREMLFTAPGAAEWVSGVIMFDETLRQKTKDGTPFPQYLAKQGMLPGIKVDTGAKPLAGYPGETITEGLDGLRERLIEYRGLGARFAKWRAVIDIAEGIPTAFAVRAGDRLPLGRTVPGGGDAAPLADQPAWAAALGADLQLRPGAAGDRAQGVGRAGCEFHRRTERTRQAREAQRPGDRRALRGRDGEPGRLSHEADAAIA